MTSVIHVSSGVDARPEIARLAAEAGSWTSFDRGTRVAGEHAGRAFELRAMASNSRWGLMSVDELVSDEGFLAEVEAARRADGLLVLDSADHAAWAGALLTRMRATAKATAGFGDLDGKPCVAQLYLRPHPRPPPSDEEALALLAWPGIELVRAPHRGSHLGLARLLERLPPERYLGAYDRDADAITALGPTDLEALLAKGPLGCRRIGLFAAPSMLATSFTAALLPRLRQLELERYQPPAEVAWICDTEVGARLERVVVRGASGLAGALPEWLALRAAGVRLPFDLHLQPRRDGLPIALLEPNGALTLRAEDPWEPRFDRPLYEQAAKALAAAPPAGLTALSLPAPTESDANHVGALAAAASHQGVEVRQLS